MIKYAVQIDLLDSATPGTLDKRVYVMEADLCDALCECLGDIEGTFRSIDLLAAAIDTITDGGEIEPAKMPAMSSEKYARLQQIFALCRGYRDIT